MKRAIHWFRNDLRIHDNEALIEAFRHNEEVIPLYIFDPRIFRSKTSFGFDKTGPYRLKFILDSLRELQSRLKQLNSVLIIREGYPEDIIPQLSREFNAHNVYCNRERTDEELEVQEALEKALWTVGREVRYYRGKMLYYTADLPFPITHSPDSFAVFRKEVERLVKVRKPLIFPYKNVQKLSINIQEGRIPTVEEFGLSPIKCDKGISLHGGESNALKRLEYLIWNSGRITTYKKNKDRLAGAENSTQLGPYLSQGCLSPKLVFHEILRYEKKYGRSDSTQLLKLDLMRRDFLRLMGKKHGSNIFKLTGIGQRQPPSVIHNETLFDKWKNGKTGVPLIDANMKEMYTTGFISGKGRHIVSSFLVNDMKLNWLAGAEYFESMLLDYDPCSNYGNWNYIAGVSASNKDNLHLTIPAQAKKYDPHAEYIKYWLPELKSIEPKLLFNPFEIDASEALSRVNYSMPCVYIKNW